MSEELSEVQRRYQAAVDALATGGTGNPMGDFMLWCADPETVFDAGAEAFVDQVFLQLAQGMWDSVRDDPEHPLYRAARRGLATQKGEHHTAMAQLRGLESEPASEDMNPSKEAVTGFVVDVVQFVRDICFDESQLSGRSLAQLEDVSLILGCGDELVAGLALYRHNYMPQAGAHARTVMETIELLELFALKPAVRDAWRSKKPGSLPAEELRPWKIREAIGKSTRDVFYDMLCDSSTHPRNLWASSRVVYENADVDELGAVRISATIGAAGTRDPLLSTTISTALVYTATLVALQLTRTSMTEAGLVANARTACALADRCVSVLERGAGGADGIEIPGFGGLIEELRAGLESDEDPSDTAEGAVD